ncbi:MAG TPA: hypothetical protein VFB07_00355 [Vicinamibacterales bacterium]|nr:hypothetical protein [Vicinamibacterales bacterium]
MTRRTVAAISLAYDGLVGVLLLAGRPLLVQLFQVPPPQPPIHADLNGVFLLSVALGYLIPYREPDSSAGRGYLWVMGPFLKGLGAVTFLLDYAFRHSPASFLIFAASDGTLALLTWWALVSAPRPRAS